MHTIPCKVPLPYPLMFAGKDPKQKKNQWIKMKCVPIISHVLTKKMSTHNNRLFRKGAEIWALYVDTCRSGEMAQNLQVLHSKN